MPSTATPPWHPIGEIAVEMGLLSTDQLNLMLRDQATLDRHLPLGELLRRFGLLRQSQVDDLLARQATRRSGALRGPPSAVPPPPEYRLIDDGDDGESIFEDDEWRVVETVEYRLEDEEIPDALAPLHPTLRSLLAHALDRGGSDLHLQTGSVPWVRVQGLIDDHGHRAMTGHEVGEVLATVLDADQVDELEQQGDVEATWTDPETGLRLRVNAFLGQTGAGVSMRLIRSEVPDLDSLLLPDEVARLVDFHQGLVLVTGPSGSGKSSTTAALVRRINETRPLHVVTLERPVEFVHPPGKASIQQREIGRDSASYASALRSALRQDPDVLVVGDLTGREVVVAALNAAETGHLVLGMMPTRDVTSTLDRLVATFPPRQRQQARGILAQSLRGILTQHLMRHVHGGLVPVVELLFNTPAVANLIREGHTHMIPNVIKTGRPHGMYRFEDSVAELRRRGILGEGR